MTRQRRKKEKEARRLERKEEKQKKMAHGRQARIRISRVSAPDRSRNFSNRFFSAVALASTFLVVELYSLLCLTALAPGVRQIKLATLRSGDR
jgi:hypothetical protein